MTNNELQVGMRVANGATVLALHPQGYTTMDMDPPISAPTSYIVLCYWPQSTLPYVTWHCYLTPERTYDINHPDHPDAPLMTAPAEWTCEIGHYHSNVFDAVVDYANRTGFRGLTDNVT